MTNFRIVALGLAALLLTACASQPKPLQGEFAQISPQDAVERDSTGAMVRWGGRIVRTEPLANRTCFEMISTRLNTYGRPCCRTGIRRPRGDRGAAPQACTRNRR